VLGQNVFLYNSSNCLIHVPNDKLVLIDGLDDMIVVESNEMLLVLKKENEQDLKKYLKNIEDHLPHLFK
jgi:mannose-1-phosphate guanylyltransferase